MFQLYQRVVLNAKHKAELTNNTECVVIALNSHQGRDETWFLLPEISLIGREIFRSEWLHTDIKERPGFLTIPQSQIEKLASQGRRYLIVSNYLLRDAKIVSKAKCKLCR